MKTMIDTDNLDPSQVWKLLGDDPGTQTMAAYGEYLRSEIDDLFLFEPTKLLDIGCSTGAVGARLKHKFPDLFVWGSEIMSQAAKQAEKKLDKVTIQSPTKFGDDERRLLSSVDTILMLDVLEHMYDPWKTLSFCNKQAMSTTQYIVSLPNIGHANVLRDLANGYWRYKSIGILDITHIRFFTLYEMRKMFYETGFRIIKTLYSTDYCVEPEKYPPHLFPVEIDFEGIKIIVQSHEHFISLNSRQILFALQPVKIKDLLQYENEFRLSQHPKTFTF